MSISMQHSLPSHFVNMYTTLMENRYRIAAVLGGFLIHLTLGNIYSFGNLMTYMDSYMHIRINENITFSNFIWVSATALASQGLFMSLAGVLEKKIGIRFTCLVGSVILSSGIALTYFTIKRSFVAVIVTYGFLSGFGIAISYVGPLACGMKWFPTKKGLVTGIIVGGFGLGSFGSTSLQTAFLNPDNIHVGNSGYFEDPVLLDRVPYVFLLMGRVFFTLQVIGCILLFEPSSRQRLKLIEEGNVLLHHMSEPEEESCEVPSTNEPPLKDLTLKEAIQTKTFFLLWFIFFLNAISIGYINAMFKSFGQTFINNDFFLAQVGALSAIFNFGGRIAWGKLMDTSSFKFSMTVMTLVQAALYFSLPFTPMMGKGTFAVWIWTIFFCFSGTFVLISTATEKAFGATHYSSIYGLIFTNEVAASLILPTINASFLHFGYSVCFFLIGAILLISTICVQYLPKNL